MDEPRQPITPAFEKAADAAEAWRQQQMAALTETQRGIFEEARRKAEQREKAKARELEGRRQSEIEEKARKKLRQEPHLKLQYKGRPVEMTEILARQLVAEQFGMQQQRGEPQVQMKVRQAIEAATRDVQQEHERALGTFKEQQRAGLDGMLRSFAKARDERAPRQEFARSAVAGKAKTDFDKTGTREPYKSTAIAHAIERVRAQEQAEKARNDRDKGRGRSISDEFNKGRSP